MKNILVLLLFFTIGCTKEVFIEIPKENILPVVNSLFQTDSIISVQINLTQPILENQPTEVRDALITLYENGIEKDVYGFGNGRYNSNTIAQIGNVYEISVSIPEYEITTAQDSLVGLPEILSISVNDSLYIGDEGDIFSQIILELDNKPQDEYYELNMFLKNLNTNDIASDDFGFDVTKSILFYDPTINDVVLQSEGLLSFFPEKLVFSDKLMTEGSHKLKINYRPSSSSFYNDNPVEDVGLVIKLRKVSKSYFEYKKTLTQHLETQFGDIWDGVGQPIPVFSNIDNGFGIFAGYSEVKDTIRNNR